MRCFVRVRDGSVLAMFGVTFFDGFETHRGGISGNRFFLLRNVMIVSSRNDRVRDRSENKTTGFSVFMQVDPSRGWRRKLCRKPIDQF